MLESQASGLPVLESSNDLTQEHIDDLDEEIKAIVGLGPIGQQTTAGTEEANADTVTEEVLSFINKHCPAILDQAAAEVSAANNSNLHQKNYNTVEVLKIPPMANVMKPEPRPVYTSVTTTPTGKPINYVASCETSSVIFNKSQEGPTPLAAQRSKKGVMSGRLVRSKTLPESSTLPPELSSSTPVIKEEDMKQGRRNKKKLKQLYVFCMDNEGEMAQAEWHHENERVNPRPFPPEKP